MRSSAGTGETRRIRQRQSVLLEPSKKGSCPLGVLAYFVVEPTTIVIHRDPSSAERVLISILGRGAAASCATLLRITSRKPDALPHQLASDTRIFYQ